MKKVFAPKCLRGRPYYVTHDKFVRPCCYFVDHGWEPNAPKDESPKGEKLWPIHDVKWLRDPKTNLKNYMFQMFSFSFGIRKEFKPVGRTSGSITEIGYARGYAPINPWTDRESF